MSESPSPSSSPPERFELTLRQRRLRMLTTIILLVIFVMILIGATQPFFHFAPPPHMTPKVRKAMAVKAMIVLSYWTVCFILAACLPIIAWLDVREVRLKMAVARRDIWREVADRHQQEKQTKRNGRVRSRRRDSTIAPDAADDENDGTPISS